MCVIKEGRRHGETDFQGFDGYQLVENESRVLKELGNLCRTVPQVYSSFEAGGNFYLVMEYLSGKSLNDLIKPRKRRLSIKKSLEFSIAISEIIENLHRSGWIWGDCKPANLLINGQNSLKAIDFEAAYAINEKRLFEWKTPEFSFVSDKSCNENDGQAGDLYALGTIIYFLLTGRYFVPEKPIRIELLRRGIPQLLCDTVHNLISNKGGNQISLAKIRIRFVNALADITKTAS